MKKLYKILLFSAFLSTVHCTLNTEDCISQWTQLPNLPVSGQVYDIFFVNENTGWVTTVNDFYTLKTTNGGMSWEVQLSGTSVRAGKLQFFNDSVGVSLGNMRILTTSNGGTNWNTVYTTPPNVFSDIFFVNQDTGWACGSDGNDVKKIWRTTDGGGGVLMNSILKPGVPCNLYFFFQKK